MKRPGVVWLYTILVILGMLSVLGGNMSTLTSPNAQYLPMIAKYAMIASLVLLVPQAIFIFFFFTMKKSAILWLYISFGLGIIINLIAQQWIWAIVMAVFGWVVWDYISNKKINNEAVFK